jgi:hypothetical protein
MTLQAIKDQVAQENGYPNWGKVTLIGVLTLVNEVATRYALAAIEQDRKDGADAAIEAIRNEGIYGYGAEVKESILDRPLPELK